MIEVFKISLIAFMFCALGEEGMIFEFYQRWIKKLPHVLHYPLGGCYICFTGQVCFWYFLLTKPFDIVELLFSVSAGILSSVIYHKIYFSLK